MKKIITLISTGIILSFNGCSSKTADEIEMSKNALADLPRWYHTPTILGDKYAAAGSAKPNTAKDMELQRIEASATARAELARMMEIRVKDMFKRATQELGLGEDQTIEHAVQYATKQITNVVLSNTSQKRIFLSKDTDILYVLYVMDNKDANKQIANSIKSSMNHEKALWNKFQATQVWNELDNETSK